MKTLLLTLLAATTIAASQAAPLETEDQALAVLQSGAPVAEKEAACLRLKEIGTAKSVPVLKALLADEGMAQWAVDALETMPGREAGDALLQALPETTGRTKALVIFALGLRRERQRCSRWPYWFGFRFVGGRGRDKGVGQDRWREGDGNVTEHSFQSRRVSARGC